MKRSPVFIHTATDHAVLKPLGLEAAPEGVMGTMDYHFYYPETPANKAFVKAFQDVMELLLGSQLSMVTSLPISLLKPLRRQAQ